MDHSLFSLLGLQSEVNMLRKSDDKGRMKWREKVGGLRNLLK